MAGRCWSTQLHKPLIDIKPVIDSISLRLTWLCKLLICLACTRATRMIASRGPNASLVPDLSDGSGSAHRSPRPYPQGPAQGAGLPHEPGQGRSGSNLRAGSGSMRRSVAARGQAHAAGRRAAGPGPAGRSPAWRRVWETARAVRRRGCERPSAPAHGALRARAAGTAGRAALPC